MAARVLRGCRPGLLLEHQPQGRRDARIGERGRRERGALQRRVLGSRGPRSRTCPRRGRRRRRGPSPRAPRSLRWGPERRAGGQVDVGRGLGGAHVVGRDDRVELAVGEPATASARSTNARDEFEASPTGTPARADRGAAARAPRAAAARRPAASSITSSSQLVQQLAAAAGLPEHPLQLGGGLERPSCRAGARLCAGVKAQAVAPEQVGLGARPGLLGVEQQTVVVEHDRLEAALHEPAMVAMPERAARPRARTDTCSPCRPSRSWGSSTSRPTRSRTAACSSTPTRPSSTG